MREVLIALVATLVVAPAAHAATGPNLAVDAGADRHAINPDIYGLNFADPSLAQELNLPVDRWGGNTTDTYNWQLHSSNTGNDYYFENVADCWDAAHNWCSPANDYNGYAAFIAKDQAAGAKPLMTLPMMGYVSKNHARDGHPMTCGFPKTVFASQDGFDPYDANCGNGQHGGTDLGSDPTRDGTPIDASYASAWVNDLKARGVKLYELGNEPALWSDTHRDMHPAPESYDELWQKTRDFGAAVKSADPSAQVLGFSEWGWPNYFCSGKDDTSDGCSASDVDRAAHGGTPMVDWLLQQLHAYDVAHGQRLVDYLDLHYYRQGGSTTDVTRSLWDSTYRDPSWINTQIQLIPRMRQWVGNDYPGTKLALSEYNLSFPGGGVQNTLIQADTLGIFAREGVDLATRWETDDDNGSDIADAFRIFRNYDGAHHTFGDTWVRSTSGDQGQLAVYAAQRASDHALTVLVVNKSTSPLTSPLALAGATPGGPAQVWQWTGGAIARAADQSVGASGFTATYPARSLTLLLVPTDQPVGSPGPGGGTTTPPTESGGATSGTTGGPAPGGQTSGSGETPSSSGGGPSSPPAATPPPPAGFTVATVRAAGASNAITVSANASGPGTLSAVATAKGAAAKRRGGRAATIAYGSASTTTTQAGPVTLTIKPSGAAKRALKAGRTLTVTVAIAFTPRDGVAPVAQKRTMRVRARHK
jgi:hypothetical protein